MDATIAVKDVTHVYVTPEKASLALESISLTVKPGEFVSLVGPSGCGKTTLLSIISGLFAPTQGTIELAGQKVMGPSAKVGYMLQQDYLFPWRSIYENAVIGLEIQGKRIPEHEQYVDHLLEEMGLLSNKHDSPAQLSGGMRQRVALVRTLATKPDYMLLDEPFSALDYQTKLQLEDLVAKTLKTHKKTALLVTHDISEAIAMSDRVIILEPSPGRIRREVMIPSEIRGLLPFSARDQEGFQRLFQEIWKEFEDMRRKGGVDDAG